MLEIFNNLYIINISHLNLEIKNLCAKVQLFEKIF